jgi:hypothetical protein
MPLSRAYTLTHSSSKEKPSRGKQTAETLDDILHHTKKGKRRESNLSVYSLLRRHASELRGKERPRNHALFGPKYTEYELFDTVYNYNTNVLYTVRRLYNSQLG